MWWPQLWPGYDDAQSVWQPVSDVPKYGVWPLVLGTLKVTVVAMIVAVPLGVGAALYISQYASPKVRETVKPIVELLAGIPSVVLGFFALIVMASWSRTPSTSVAPERIVSGVALSFAVIPVIFTLAEEAIRAVPRSYGELRPRLARRAGRRYCGWCSPRPAPGSPGGRARPRARVGETMIVLMASATPRSFRRA